MEDLEFLIAGLFISVLAVNLLAERLSLPYPILLVLGGLLLGLIPGIPEVELEPDLVLVVFLPPLLYFAALTSDLGALRDGAGGLSALALGLVLLTTCGVALVAHEVIDLPWAAAFVLGAVVSPTDPLAATSIMSRLGAPRRIINVVEGESLVNDATALVAYRVAVTAAVGGSFSLIDASAEFVVASVGGAAIGLLAGYVIALVRARIADTDTTSAMTVSLFSGYAAFLPAEVLGLSGVLAAVACGVYLGWRAPEPQMASPVTRLETFAVWGMLIFLLNAILFILIGLQLPLVVEALGSTPLLTASLYALLVVATVVGIRFAWFFTVPYLFRMIDRRPGNVARRIDPRSRAVMAWSGMRGAVSLAAALAIPLETDSGTSFPERELILFITFGVILFTTVGQGLSLPAVIRGLGVSDDGEEDREETLGRMKASRAAIELLDELIEEDWTRDETIERVRGAYEFRYRRFAARVGKVEDDGIEDRSQTYQRMMHLLYARQRERLAQLRNEGLISNQVMHRLEREVDLEESRLEV